MKLNLVWQEKMIFTGKSGVHEVKMDTKSPIGSDSALTPKQLMIAGLCGCTAMDVIALLKKHKQPVESFEVTSESTPTEGVHPAVYSKIHLVFRLKGELDPQKVMESVRLSQTRYCGVSAMLSKSVPITYEVEVNGIQVGTGQAEFN